MVSVSLFLSISNSLSILSTHPLSLCLSSSLLCSPLSMSLFPLSLSYFFTFSPFPSLSLSLSVSTSFPHSLSFNLYFSKSLFLTPHHSLSHSLSLPVSISLPASLFPSLPLPHCIYYTFLLRRVYFSYHFCLRFFLSALSNAIISTHPRDKIGSVDRLLQHIPTHVL